MQTFHAVYNCIYIYTYKLLYTTKKHCFYKFNFDCGTSFADAKVLSGSVVCSALQMYSFLPQRAPNHPTPPHVACIILRCSLVVVHFHDFLFMLAGFSFSRQYNNLSTPHTLTHVPGESFACAASVFPCHEQFTPRAQQNRNSVCTFAAVSHDDTLFAFV